MNIARSLGDAIINPPERHSPRWWVSRIIPPTVTTAEFVAAVATLLHHTELGQVENLLTTAKLLDNFVSATHIDPAVTLAVLAITHIGGNRIMALLEMLMKPLLDAQLEVGKEKGRAEAEAEFEEWKAKQRAAGAQFVDDDDEPESDQPPACDQ